MKDQLTLPGGVDVAKHDIYVIGPIFGPEGKLQKVK